MYDVYETNPVSSSDKEFMDSATRTVSWTHEGLYITRLRMISDPGYPVWDISYCYGEINGEAVRVSLPFSQLPKFKMKAALFAEAKRTGKFIKGLFDNISTLN